MFSIGTAIKLILYIIIIVIGGGSWYVTNLKADLANSRINSLENNSMPNEQSLIRFS